MARTCISIPVMVVVPPLIESPFANAPETSGPGQPTPRPDPLEVAVYIHALTSELAAMAANADLPDLASALATTRRAAAAALTRITQLPPSPDEA
jgi:hypothetical protein